MVNVNEGTILQLKDGDLLFVRVPVETSIQQVRVFTNAVKERIASLGVKAEVIVAAGDIEMEIVKGTQLEGIISRLEALERIHGLCPLRRGRLIAGDDVLEDLKALKSIPVED